MRGGWGFGYAVCFGGVGWEGGFLAFCCAGFGKVERGGGGEWEGGWGGGGTGAVGVGCFGGGGGDGCGDDGGEDFCAGWVGHCGVCLGCGIGFGGMLVFCLLR